MRNSGLLLLLACVLVLSGCGGGRNSKAGKVRSVQQVAPSYDVSGDRKSRKRERYQELMRLSADRYGRGELDEALKHARSAQKIDPAVADAYTLQAAIEDGLGNAAQAGVLYRKATEIAPNEAGLLSNYGAWLCGNGHPAESLVWFDRVLVDAAYAGRGETLANAGGCALEAGQRERADLDLREALVLRPSNPYALESMARSEYGEGRYFEARAFYQRRLAAAPATISVLQLAVQIEDRLGDKVAASRYQQRLREEFPSAATSNPQD